LTKQITNTFCAETCPTTVRRAPTATTLETISAASVSLTSATGTSATGHFAHLKCSDQINLTSQSDYRYQ